MSFRSTLNLLPAAVREHVRPGMHLHFASTPSRSNASIREVAAAFLGTAPGFTLSSSGFHSMAHLLPALGMARRLIACFYGDNYPTPRPNRLYAALEQRGVALEHWSLSSYVSALRAGARGEAWAVTRSLSGTDLGRELAAHGRYREVADPAGGAEPLGLVAALRPDVAFLHALMADEDGNVVCAAPYSEGFHSAAAARQGAIVTVERIVSRAEVARFPEAQRLPRHRLLAVCEEPHGAHPQPVFALEGAAVDGYADDFEHYLRWRSLTAEPADLQRFCDEILARPNSGAAYRAWVGAERLEALRRPSLPHRGSSARPVTPSEPPAAPASAQPSGVEPSCAEELVDPPSAQERLVLLGAWALQARVIESAHRHVLAGIGHSFQAARVAQLQLSSRRVEVDVMVETGMYGFACDARAESFLLAHANIASSRRRSDVEDILGVLTCGANNACVGVIGGAQVDQYGQVNSSRLPNGELLVGSGGANDIASAASEVVVLVSLSPERLVRRVHFVTSPGRRVRTVVTDAGVLRRTDHEGQWRLWAVFDDDPGAAERLRQTVPWPLADDAPVRLPAPSPQTLRRLRSLHSKGPA